MVRRREKLNICIFVLILLVALFLLPKNTKVFLKRNEKSCSRYFERMLSLIYKQVNMSRIFKSMFMDKDQSVIWCLVLLTDSMCII